MNGTAIDLELEAGQASSATPAEAAAARALMQADLIAQGRAEGAAAERTRILSILTSPEASGRISSALMLAGQADLSAETARGVLATLPKDATPTFDGPRSKDSPDGLAVTIIEPAAGDPGLASHGGGMSDHERGREIAKGFNR